jgi:hypothetical protein
MSSNGSPQLNCCRVLRPSPTYVPHETTTPASIAPPASARIPSLRPERLSPPPASPFSTLSQHAEARSLLPTPHFRPLSARQPTIPTSSEPARAHSIPIDQWPRTERLPSSRCIRIAPHTAAPLPAAEPARSRYSTKTLRAARSVFRVRQHGLPHRIGHRPNVSQC